MTLCSRESVWLTRYLRSAAAAATSNAASATSVTATTPTITRVRSWGRRRGLVIITALRIAGPRRPQDVADAALRVDHLRPMPRELAPQVPDIGRHDRA